jgi:hypothetical protein
MSSFLIDLVRRGGGLPLETPLQPALVPDVATTLGIVQDDSREAAEMPLDPVWLPAQPQHHTLSPSASMAPGTGTAAAPDVPSRPTLAQTPSSPAVPFSVSHVPAGVPERMRLSSVEEATPSGSVPLLPQEEGWSEGSTPTLGNALYRSSPPGGKEENEAGNRPRVSVPESISSAAPSVRVPRAPLPQAQGQPQTVDTPAFATSAPAPQQREAPAELQLTPVVRRHAAAHTALDSRGERDHGELDSPVPLPSSAVSIELPPVFSDTAAQATEPGAPRVQVRIGRVEVRVTQPPGSVAPVPTRVSRGFDEYAAVRSYLERPWY